MKKSFSFHSVINKDFQPAIKLNTFHKKPKKRLLPNIFYLGWELELLCAFVSGIVLMILPSWLNEKVNILLAGYGASMSTGWITISCNILLAGFIIYIVSRTFWLFFIDNCKVNKPQNIQLAKLAGMVSQILFSLCIITLLMILLVSLVQFLSTFLQATLLDKMKVVTDVN